MSSIDTAISPATTAGKAGRYAEDCYKQSVSGHHPDAGVLEWLEAERAFRREQQLPSAEDLTALPFAQATRLRNLRSALMI